MNTPTLHELFGRRDTIAGHCRRLGISPASTIYSRVNKLGWTLERAVNHRAHGSAQKIYAFGQWKTRREWAESTGLSQACIWQRLRRGWSVEEALTTPHKRSAYYPKNARLITFRGETKCLAEWAREAGLTDKLIDKRLRLGWSIERALTTPLRQQGRSRFITAFGRTQSLTDWANEYGIRPRTLAQRIDTSGLDPETALKLPVKGR